MGGVQLLGIHIGGLGADAVRFFPVGVIPVRLRDLVPINARHHWALFREVVAVDTHQDKRRNDQQEQQEHHDLGMLADGFKHGLDLSVTKTKGELSFAFVCMVVGPDGLEPPTYSV